MEIYIMEMLMLIVGLLLVVWFLGFLASARKLAAIANRQVSALELAQAEQLKKKYNKAKVSELKSYLADFDTEDLEEEPKAP
jgi:hypothetical protein